MGRVCPRGTAGTGHFLLFEAEGDLCAVPRLNLLQLCVGKGWEPISGGAESLLEGDFRLGRGRSVPQEEFLCPRFSGARSEPSPSQSPRASVSPASKLSPDKLH